MFSCGARAAECFGCLSRWAICFCGEVGQNRPLGDRSSTSRALFGKERRSVVPGGAAVDLVAVHQATSIDVRFRGHQGAQAQEGNGDHGHTRQRRGARSGVGASGGAVALMVELLSDYLKLPESAPLLSYMFGNEVRVWSTPMEPPPPHR